MKQEPQELMERAYTIIHGVCKAIWYSNPNNLHSNTYRNPNPIGVEAVHASA